MKTAVTTNRTNVPRCACAAFDGLAAATGPAVVFGIAADMLAVVDIEVIATTSVLVDVIATAPIWRRADLIRFSKITAMAPYDASTMMKHAFASPVVRMR